MHLPLLSRLLLLFVQFLILAMALPAARHVAAPATEQLSEREATAEVKPDAKDAPVRRTVFGKRVTIEKPSSPVKAMVRSPDTVQPRGERA
ncbi:hypothetical protein MMC13_000557 [Lambiella insularis]|nr:hypothetical protein [Lambiella insularis]